MSIVEAASGYDVALLLPTGRMSQGMYGGSLTREDALAAAKQNQEWRESTIPDTTGRYVAYEWHREVVRTVITE